MKKKCDLMKSSFENEWIDIFAKNTTQKDLKKHVVSTGNYIWHVFSWELLPNDFYLVGDEAKKAFDAEDKIGARYYEPYPNRDQIKPKLNTPSADEIEKLTECYVISADKTWTYIKTHEGDSCGPYFYKLGNK